MTGLAGQVVVSACQAETGFSRMFESAIFPVPLRVAAVTIIAIAPQVNILYPVTADAIVVFKIVLLACMTTAAIEGFVMPAQWKFSAVVIEGLPIMPTAGLMTVATLHAQGLAMGVLLLMTTMAGSRGLPIRSALLVASFAERCGVRAQEGKVSVGMSKGVPVEQYTVVVPALMVLVTGPAFRFSDKGRTPVKTRILATVDGDRLMTIEAKSILG